MTSPLDRRTLPIRQPADPQPTAMDARDRAAGPPRAHVRPPAGAPNVLVVLLDDVGFGAPSPFGGPCSMPTAERLAAGGLRYTRFHTTAICSPTRQSLMTGRNHHSVGMGAITNFATSAPGYNGVRPASAATLARVANGNGYGTAAFGKWHQTPQWELSAAGPFDRWPTGEGFEKFYGFMGGACSQWEPFLYDGTTQCEPLDRDDATLGEYHLSEDLADQTIEWLERRQTLSPDQPFLAYLSFGACHSPHHVSSQYREKYRGRFDNGWDVERAETLERQKALGIVPPEAELAPWSPGVPHWDELDDQERRLSAAFMENFAGFAEHTDDQLGRVVDQLEAQGILDDTLIVYVLGDNGGSPEGGLAGTFNQLAIYNGFTDDVETMSARLDELGTLTTNANFPVGWALATNSPYQWTKQVASHFGGTRNGLIVHWPNGIAESGGLRHQFHHIIDVMPTILEAASLPEPNEVDGVAQQPIEGTSMMYSFNNAEAPDQRVTQYFEMLGNRGIYHQGWMAVTCHRAPWQPPGEGKRMFADDVWELYDLVNDWTQAHDLAQDLPEKLRELQDIFLIEAAKYQVFPLDDRTAERADPQTAGRPDILGGRNSMRFTRGMRRFAEDTVPNVKNRSHQISAEIVLSVEGATGVIVSQGGRFGGWDLSIGADGCLAYRYNFLGIEDYVIADPTPLGVGRHRVEFRFDYDGGGVGRGGRAQLLTGDRLLAEGRVEATIPFFFCSDTDQTLDVGQTLVEWVQIDVAGKDVAAGSEQLQGGQLAQQ